MTLVNMAQASKRGGVYCAAINCSVNTHNSEKISLFRFPKDDARCKKWKDNTRRSDLDCKSVEELNQTFRLCSRHFEDSQFMNTRHDRLIWNAIPTLFYVPYKPSPLTLKRRLIVIQTPKSKVSAKTSTNIPTEHKNSAETFSSSTLIASSNFDFLPSVSKQCVQDTDIPLGGSTRSLSGEAAVGIRMIADAFTPSPVSRNAHSSYALHSEQPSSSLVQVNDGLTFMQPRPPVKPLLPYRRYSQMISQSIRKSFQANQKKLKVGEVGKIIGQMWKELSVAEKQLYADEYESEKIQYAEALKVYHDSLEYRSWIAAKKKAEVDSRRSRAPPRRVIVIQRRKEDRGQPPPPPSVDPRPIVIQPMEEEDELVDGRSVKHIAGSGYQCYYNLNNQISSDTLMPDPCKSNPQIRDNMLNMIVMAKEEMKEEQRTAEQLQPSENKMKEEDRLPEVFEQDSKNQISESFVCVKDSVTLPSAEGVLIESASEVKREDC